MDEIKKAYDLKRLGELISEKAKAKGLILAEQALEELGLAVYEGAKEWVTESAAISEMKLDDAIAPFITLLDGLVTEQIKKIDLGGVKETPPTDA